MDEYGLVNLDQKCDLIVATPRLLIDSIGNGADMQLIIEQLSNSVFQ